MDIEQPQNTLFLGLSHFPQKSLLLLTSTAHNLRFLQIRAQKQEPTLFPIVKQAWAKHPSLFFQDLSSSGAKNASILWDASAPFTR